MIVCVYNHNTSGVNWGLVFTNVINIDTAVTEIGPNFGAEK